VYIKHGVVDDLCLTNNKQVLERSSVRSRRLQSALYHLHGHLTAIDELIDWLSDVHAKLLAANDMLAPSDAATIQAVIRQHKVHTCRHRNHRYYSEKHCLFQEIHLECDI